MVEFSFNLVDKPWIPCADQNGKPLMLGIRDLLQEAHVLRSIQHQNPLTEAALLRLLLAVVHRAANGPRNSTEWKVLYEAGRFDERVTQYLEKWYSRFDLFSPDKPFYQTPGLLVVDSLGNPVPQAIGSLMLERASGNNKTLFDHTTDGIAIRVTPSEAAHVLITAQMFSLGGLNKKTTNFFGYQPSFRNGAMVNGIFIVLAGGSLFETLLLNLLIYSDNEPIPNTDEDCPVWERDDMGGTTVAFPKGYLGFLTCKSRHICLAPYQVDGAVFVEHIHLAQGEAFPEVSNPGFFKKKKRDGTWYYPQLDVDRLVWRDSVALFSFDADGDNRPKAFRQVHAMRNTVALPNRYVCQAHALANNKANPLAWRKDKLSVPLELLSDRNVVAHLERGIALSEKAANALNDAVKSFMREYLPRNSKDVPEKAKATGAVQTYWNRLEGHFQSFLLDFSDPENALCAWEESLKRTSRKALEQCVRGRYSGGRTFRAWSAANAYLNVRLAKLHE